MSEDPAPALVDPAVVDTDVLSFWLKKDTRGSQYSEALAGRTLVISFQTVAELLRWAEEHEWGEPRRQNLDEQLRQFMVIPYSMDLAR